MTLNSYLTLDPKITKNSKIDPEIKRTIVNALMKVVQRAPRISRFNTDFDSLRGTIIRRQNNYRMYEVSEKQFNVWMDYVHSTLDIASKYVNTELYTVTQIEIQTVIMRTDLNYKMKTNRICQIILNFSKSIADL